jgi:hypothetical protein
MEHQPPTSGGPGEHPHRGAGPVWASLAEPIARTRPWRTAAPQPEQDWAGRGFSRPGPEAEAEREAGS